ncbi:YraN family protein [Pantanalinema sp. GBBB05]|uniref:YraN family protein n=1 Tax=Pantanalinema sp. GBBB05 TaxID=2604139 RepID=UPI001D6E9514|nr:YraN family protein [Pantanalinema sp. GBBB05]
MGRSSRSQSQSPNSSGSGTLGEAFVAQWLQARGWVVLYRRWHCRWGELDLVIAQRDPESDRLVSIAFVEVKTRSSGNWDADGLLAITSQKQAKLWKAAQYFLADHPQLAELPCRFDIALVSCQRVVNLQTDDPSLSLTTQIRSGYRLTLNDYLPAVLMQ